MNATVQHVGFFSRLPAAEYHALDDVSVSRLKEIVRSPKHYRYRLAHPLETPPMRLGTAAHCAVLEPELFSLTYAVWTRRTEGGAMAPRRGKAWEEFCSENEGLRIVTEDEHTTAVTIARAVHGDETAMKYLRVGEPEVTLRALLHGRMCRGRVDWLCTVERPAIVGLKTARNPEHYAFAKAAASLKYYWHWAMYHDLYLELTGKKPLVKEIVVESSPPHDVVVYDVDDDAIEQGREEYVEAMARLAYCEAHDQWHGIAGGTELALSLPTHVYAREGSDDLADLDLETA